MAYSQVVGTQLVTYICIYLRSSPLFIHYYQLKLPLTHKPILAIYHKYEVDVRTEVYAYT